MSQVGIVSEGIGKELQKGLDAGLLSKVPVSCHPEINLRTAADFKAASQVLGISTDKSGKHREPKSSIGQGSERQKTVRRELGAGPDVGELPITSGRLRKSGCDTQPFVLFDRKTGVFVQVVPLTEDTERNGRCPDAAELRRQICPWSDQDFRSGKRHVDRVVRDSNFNVDVWMFSPKSLKIAGQQEAGYGVCCCEPKSALDTL